MAQIYLLSKPTLGWQIGIIPSIGAHRDTVVHRLCYQKKCQMNQNQKKITQPIPRPQHKLPQQLLDVFPSPSTILSFDRTATCLVSWVTSIRRFGVRGKFGAIPAEELGCTWGIPCGSIPCGGIPCGGIPSRSALIGTTPGLCMLAVFIRGLGPRDLWN